MKATSAAGNSALGGELEVHWRRPDKYGYRALLITAKPERGAIKEARTIYKAEHDRLSALWKEHCPKRISRIMHGRKLVSTGAACGWHEESSSNLTTSFI